jgi:hypothetical protein
LSKVKKLTIYNFLAVTLTLTLTANLLALPAGTNYSDGIIGNSDKPLFFLCKTHHINMWCCCIDGGFMEVQAYIERQKPTTTHQQPEYYAFTAEQNMNHNLHSSVASDS